MQYYCLTTGCLREYILRYFGEFGTGRCENCRNCALEYEETDITQAAIKITACIRECRQRYGINVTAGILAGETRAKLREYGVSRYESYGSLKELRETEIKAMIQQMLVEGLLCVTNDRYALLKVQPAADDVIQGRRQVILKKPKTAAQSTEKGRSSQSSKLRRSDILNSKGLDLFERLRALRTEIAKEEGMPPYIIFSDKTLVDMCVKAPLDKSDMMQVTGVGENKYSRYGERFLAVILAYTGGMREKYYFGESPALAGKK